MGINHPRVVRTSSRSSLDERLHVDISTWCHLRRFGHPRCRRRVLAVDGPPSARRAAGSVPSAKSVPVRVPGTVDTCSRPTTQTRPDPSQRTTAVRCDDGWRDPGSLQHRSTGHIRADREVPRRDLR